MSSPTKTHYDIRFVQDSIHEGHTLDLYEPESHPGGAKIPLVVYIHGGGWTERDKKGTCPTPV